MKECKMVMKQKTIGTQFLLPRNLHCFKVSNSFSKSPLNT